MPDIRPTSLRLPSARTCRDCHIYWVLLEIRTQDVKWFVLPNFASRLPRAQLRQIGSSSRTIHSTDFWPVGSLFIALSQTSCAVCFHSNQNILHEALGTMNRRLQVCIMVEWKHIFAVFVLFSPAHATYWIFPLAGKLLQSLCRTRVCNKSLSLIASQSCNNDALCRHSFAVKFNGIGLATMGTGFSN